MTLDPTFRRIMEPKPNWRITSDAVVIGEPVDYVGGFTFRSDANPLSPDLQFTEAMLMQEPGDE